MMGYLFRVAVIFLLFHNVARSEMVPLSRSNKELILSNTRGSLRAYEESGLLCGVGCRENCRDEYQIEVSDQAEPRSMSEGIRYTPFGVSKRVVSNREARCDESSMVRRIQRRRGIYRLGCSRLSPHLRKTTRTGSSPLFRLSRMSVGGASNFSQVMPKGRVVREELVVRQRIDESVLCDDTYYLDGMRCANTDCSEVQLLCVQIEVDQDAANKLFCDLLSSDRDSMFVGLATDWVRRKYFIPGSGSLFGGLAEIRGVLWSLLLAGLHVLGDVEWQSPFFGQGERVSCPDGMFLSDMTYERLLPAAFPNRSEVGIFQVSIGCSRLERDLRIGSPTYSCGFDPRTGEETSSTYCKDGFVTGVIFGDDTCPYLKLECRSLECL